MKHYPHDVVVALIVKYALVMGMLDSKESIKKTDDFIKEHLAINSHKQEFKKNGHNGESN